MASLNSIFDSVGRATSTPRVNVNPSQGARSKLLSRDFTVPSAEPFRQSRWGRRIKPPVVYSP